MLNCKMKTDKQKLFQRLLATILFICFISQMITITKHSLNYASFQAINEYQFDELLAPAITICPGPGWKSSNISINEEEFAKNKFSWEEIFHPDILEKYNDVKNFRIKETYEIASNLPSLGCPSLLPVGVPI